MIVMGMNSVLPHGQQCCNETASSLAEHVAMIFSLVATTRELAKDQMR
jgi:hypothetical protein